MPTQSVGTSAASADTAAAPAAESVNRLHQLLTDLIRQNIPLEYEELDNWGATKDFSVGVDVDLDGLKLKTKRRRKSFKHGTWKMYRVSLVDPQRQFQVRVERVRELPNGRVEVELSVEALLHAFARLSEWQRGVQLFSVSADAYARVRLRLTCEMGARLDLSRLPPDVLFDPVVTAAELELAEFRLQRISDWHGPVVKELGKALRDVVADKLRKQQEKLPDKLNAQIAKNRDDLRLSVHDLIATEWGKLAARRLNVPAGDGDELDPTPAILDVPAAHSPNN